MIGSRTAEIGICRDCGGEVEQRGRDLYRCSQCGQEWDLQAKHDYWRAANDVDVRSAVTDGGVQPGTDPQEWEMPEGHGQSDPAALPPRVFLLPAVAFTGGVFGATLGALTSPVTAILLVGALIIGSAGSIVLFREVRD